jgi:broad specificity phosphatase PhoE
MVKMRWPKRLIIVRHGQSEHNKILDDINEGFSTKSLQKLSKIRDADLELTDLGKEQALKTGKYFKKRGEKFDIVFYSPYKRTCETKNKIIEGYSKKIESYEDIRIREREYGRLHFLNEEQIKKQFPYEHNARILEGEFYYRLLGGENYPDVGMRVMSFLDMLSRDYAGKNVLIVTHYFVYKMFRFWIERLGEEDILFLKDVPNCGIQIYDISKDGKKLILKDYNSVGY